MSSGHIRLTITLPSGALHVPSGFMIVQLIGMSLAMQHDITQVDVMCMTHFTKIVLK